MKKIISLLMAFVMLFSVTAGVDLSAYAADATSGKCGDNVYWSYDPTTNTLTISGTGAMCNYNGDAPWDGYWEDISTVKIETGVTTIGEGAFMGCISLTSVTIPNSVTTIGEGAFFACSLTSVTIPDSVTKIGNEAFYNCSSLTSVTISNSVTTIGWSAFWGCSSLTSIDVASGNSNYLSKDGVLFNKNESNLIQYPAGNQRTEYTIPNSVTTIGNSAFSGCSSLTSVTIPYSVTIIGNYAFNCCSRLTSVTIPNSVTTIRNFAFNGCSSLTSITIPNSVTTIGKGAFGDCHRLTSIDVASGNLMYSSKDGVLFDKNKSTLIQYPQDNQRTEYTIPNSVTTIEESAIFGCISLTSVTIPNSVITIEDWAFDDCKNLTSIDVASGNSNYSSKDGVLFDKNKSKLIQYPACNQRTEYTMPNSVTTIEIRAFEYCSSLTSVTISNSVTTIGEYAFYNCSSLTSVIIPNSVITIETWAFEYCSSLTSVTIPNSVTTIVDFAFSGCSSLKDVYYSGSEEQWKKISIGFDNDDLLNAEIHYNSLLPDQPETGGTTGGSTGGTTGGSSGGGAIGGGGGAIPAPAPDETDKKDDDKKPETTPSLPAIPSTTNKPAAVTTNKPKAKKNSLVVTWKPMNNADGYEIQVATDKKFKKNKKSVIINKKNAKKKTIKNLKKNKKYFVRVRAYKIVDGKKSYGKWSKIKSIKTK